MTTGIDIGTAGWAIPRAVADAFPTEGSGLQRYAARFPIVEINSTFYRPHRLSTFERWATSTPEHFRFCVKAPRAMTHEARLVDCGPPMNAFLAGVRGLGAKLGVLLFQLPPSLAFDPSSAEAFFAMVRDLESERDLVCEPRHASWFEKEADALLKRFQVARAAADPARHPLAGRPGGWPSFAYHRLHGSPRLYYSSYTPARLEALAETLVSDGVRTWCVFDNTASGAAAVDAMALQDRLGRR